VSIHADEDTNHYTKADWEATTAEEDGNYSYASMHTSDDGYSESQSETQAKSVLNDRLIDKLRPKDKNEKMDPYK
jgi:hypothetical protein